MSTEIVAVRMGAGQRAEHIERACIHWRIVSPVEKAHFIGQIAHESRGFSSFVESMNYTPAALIATFPRARITVEQAHALGRVPGRPAQQEAIANLVYANRFGNGPPESGDGWKYRGHGDNQITFKANYMDCSRALFGDLRLLDDPALLVLAEHGPMAAGWFWHTNGCGALATDMSDEAIRRVTIRINGGTNGLDDRAVLTRRAYDLFMAMEAGG